MPINLERINSARKRTEKIIIENKACIDSNKHKLLMDLGILSGWLTVFSGCTLAAISEGSVEKTVLSLASQVGISVTTGVCALRFSKIWLLKDMNMQRKQERNILDDMYEIGIQINQYPEMFEDRDNKVVYISNIPPLTTAMFKN